LDEGDGFILEILHQGDSPGKVLGTLRGAKIKDKGMAILSTSSLVAMSETHWWKRVGDRKTLTVIGLPIILMLLAEIALLFIIHPWRAAHLVPVDAYNLATLDGQNDFATAVRDMGQIYTPLAAAALALFPLFLLVFVSLVWRLQRRPIPLSILHRKYFKVASPESLVQEPKDDNQRTITKGRYSVITLGASLGLNAHGQLARKGWNVDEVSAAQCRKEISCGLTPHRRRRVGDPA
jgi:hypothetical protein